MVSTVGQEAFQKHQFSQEFVLSQFEGSIEGQPRCKLHYHLFLAALSCYPEFVSTEIETQQRFSKSLRILFSLLWEHECQPQESMAAAPIVRRKGKFNSTH